MTNAQFVEAIQKLVEKRTKRGARTKLEARKQLIKEGIIDASGELTANYGGKVAKSTGRKKVAA